MLEAKMNPFRDSLSGKSRRWSQSQYECGLGAEDIEAIERAMREVERR
jgi:hypothetical protein